MATKTSLRNQKEKLAQVRHPSQQNPDIGMPKVPVRSRKPKQTRELLSDWCDAP
jgi:hypothetical protein